MTKRRKCKGSRYTPPQHRVFTAGERRTILYAAVLAYGEAGCAEATALEVLKWATWARQEGPPDHRAAVEAVLRGEVLVRLDDDEWLTRPTEPQERRALQAVRSAP